MVTAIITAISSAAVPSSPHAAIRLAAAAAAGALAVASGRNILQTWLICRQSSPSSSPQRTPSIKSSVRAHERDFHCPDPTLEPFTLPRSSQDRPRDSHDHDALLDGMERGEGEIQKHEYDSVSGHLQSTPDIVRRLQAMDRAQLLRLYLSPCCAAPGNYAASVSRRTAATTVANSDDGHDNDDAVSLTELVGEWEGILLNNRGAIMTGVAHFLTHVCFAWGGDARWRGKSFFAASSTAPHRRRRFDAEPGDGTASSSSHEKHRTGANRIVLGRKRRSSSRQEHRHSFKYSLGRSGFQLARHCDQITSIGNHRDEATALILDYRPHQPWYSPWKTMTDELRVVRLASRPSCLGTAAPGDGGEMGTVLLGWGYMQWSGGILNASPFCLYRAGSSR